MIHEVKPEADNSLKGESKKPLISVVTIVLNGEKCLEETIQSVIRNKTEETEYLIIDGGSVDNTLEIIRKYSDKIDFWISEPDGGIADAFNKGFKYSSGRYIAYLNSDDYYLPGALSSVIPMLKDPGTIYCGHIHLLTPDGLNIIKDQLSQPWRIKQTMRIAHPATFTPREAFIATGGFLSDYKIAMDYDFMVHAFLKGFRFEIMDVFIAGMRRGGNSSDLKTVYKEELKIKNKRFGYKIQHYIWYLLNLARYLVMPKKAIV